MSEYMSNPYNNHDDDDWGELLDSDDPMNIRSIQAVQSDDKQMNNYTISLAELKQNIDMFDITRSSDIEILNYVGAIFKSLKFIFSQNELNRCEIDICDQIFESIEHIVKELAVRNKQYVEYIIKKPEKDIWRNSYKFCEYRHMCKFFYNNNSQCYSKHYEYMSMYSDIIELRSYIRSNAVHNQDLIKISINTLTYVANHMCDELTNLQKYSPYHYSQYNLRKIINKYHKKKYNTNK